MTTNSHTAYPFGGPLTSAAMEFPLGQLDAAISTVIATGSGASTTLTAIANAGQASLTVASSAGFTIGDPIYIGTGATYESRIVLTIPDSTHITVSVNLTNTYASGKPVSKSPVEIVDARGGLLTLGARLAAMEFAANVKFYGAKGDGATDDSAAVQAAVAAVNAAGGGTVWFPAGTYQVPTAITIPGDNINIRGAGAGATVLRRSGAGAMFVNSSTGSVRYRFSLSDLTINGQGGASASGVKLENFYFALVERVIFENYGGIGVEFYGTGSTYHNVVRSCFFTLSVAGSTGIKWTAGAANPNGNAVVSSIGTAVTGTTFLNLAGGDTALVLGCNFEGADAGTTLATVGAASSHARFIGNRFEAGTLTITGTDVRFLANTEAATVVRTNAGVRFEVWGDGGPARCIIQRTTDQVITTSTITKITFDGEIADDWGIHAASSTDVVIPAKGAALYRIRADATWAANATGIRQLHIYINGTSSRQAVVPSAASAGDRLSQTVTLTKALAVGDIIDVRVYHTAGADLNIASGSLSPVLSVERV